MKRLLLIFISLSLIAILAYEYNNYKNTADQPTKTDVDTSISLANNNFSKIDFKAKNEKELCAQDFETVYELGKSFLYDYYLQKAGLSKIDFSKYIVNENLLRYSNKRVLVENYILDIKRISIGLDKAELIRKENCYYLMYAITTENSYNGGFAEPVEILISNVDGKLVLSDWYIRFGAGSSSYDEKFRSNESIHSPKVWDNKEYVNKIFGKAGL